MLADLGFYLLLLSGISTGYGAIAALCAAKLRHKRLYRSAQAAAIAAGLLTVTAAVIFWYLLYTRNYGVSYIYKNSSNDLPWHYTFSAFWSSLEGSHFLWTLLLAIFTMIAHLSYNKENEHIMPYVSAALQSVLAWMYYLAVTYSNPFEPTFPVQENGLGMNALLQNPYMMIHPPSLFTGYTCLAIPYAYCIAALCYGDVTEGWVKTARRWTLFAWSFLTFGIFLGGRWAYVELGWAGYWAWDPVENSSFLPWLFATALLHSLLIQEKLGQLKRLSIGLGIFGFFFSFFGTFITRSGVISSVHSFAQSPIGPNYLIFLGAIAFVALLLYGLRSQLILPSKVSKIWGTSKETAVIVGQFVLITFAVIVFIGTVYPIVSEALMGVRFNIQAPYFNTFAPYIGFSLVLVIMVGNLMAFHTGKISGGPKVFLICLIGSLPFSIFFTIKGGILESIGYALAVQIVGTVLSFWAMFCLLWDAYDRYRQTSKAKIFLSRNLAYIGGLLAHLGMVVALLGFLGNYRGVDTTKTIKPGESAQLMGYNFKFLGMDIFQEDNATMYSAPLEITHEINGKTVGHVLPARAKYPTKDELFHEVGILEGFWHDIYVVLSDFDVKKGEKVTLQLHINPTVKVVWISVFLMVLGGIIAFFDPRRGRRSKDVLAGSWEFTHEH